MARGRLPRTAGPSGGRRTIDWAAHKAAYLGTPHGNISQYAREHGLNEANARDRAARENWKGEWESAQAASVEHARALVVKRRAEAAVEWDDRLLGFAEQLYQDLVAERQRHIVDTPNGPVSKAGALTKRRWASTLSEIQGVVRTVYGLPRTVTSLELSAHMQPNAGGPVGPVGPGQPGVDSPLVIEYHESPPLPPEPTGG